MFEGARCLVAGGTGFIGSNLVKRLTSMGARVRATYHERPPVIIDSIEYVKADLLTMADCKKAVDSIDYVFMCAASTAGAAVISSNPLYIVTPNIIMNAQMLEAAYFEKVTKFIFISSNAVYPPTGSRPVTESEIFNGDPHDVYFGGGWMKRYTEILCRLYSEKLKPSMKTVVIRPSNVYGPGDDFDFGTSHVMAATIRKVIERHDPIEVWGDGNDVRDLIYIDDFIDGLLLAAEKIDTFNPVNIGYGRGYSIKQILQMAIEIDGFSDARIVYNSLKPSMIPIRLIDVSKAERVLGFRPKMDIREGIRKTINWFMENYYIDNYKDAI